MKNNLTKAKQKIKTCLKNQETALNLSECNITDLKELPELQDCVQLRTLNLSNNKISDISPLSNMTDLQDLDLAMNQISDLAPLSNLTGLNHLELSSNQISDLAPLSNLTGLNHLGIVDNQISDLAPLSNLTGLNHLELSSNQISDISPLSNLTDLQDLDLAMNQISDLAPLSNLIGLQKLRLWGNQISDLAPLSNLTDLQDLDLAMNQISDLFPLSNMTGLQKLNLWQNQISDLSPLSNMTDLQDLDLAMNQISEISPLSNLTGLYYLELSRNQISDISPLSNLTSLNHLELTSNQISDISPLSNLTDLQDLDLAMNQISDLAPLSNLTGLQALHLAKNQISDITPLSNLTGLYYLDLDENQIKEVPEFIFKFNLATEHLRLEENPIESPPLAVLNLGKEDVLNYFSLLKKEGGAENIYEAKLTLVGEGGAGKTSLQLRLLNKDAKLPEASIHTRGVEITDWNISETEEKKEIVHIWDFGGQDMYFPVHRFFLTENSVYVLMASSRIRGAHNFDYWIPSIYQFGGESPILIAQTCHDGHHEPWLGDLTTFLGNSKFNIIRVSKDCYFKLNLINENEGIDAIRSNIIAQMRELFTKGKPVPPSFIHLRNKLLEEMQQQPCMAFETYEKFCGQVDDTFKDESTLKLFTATMHNIGALLWYKHNPVLKNWVILKPEWVMKAVYALIDDKKIEQNNGHISQADFDRLWHETTYKHRQPVLKQMLEVFKIAFPKRSTKQAYILPARQLAIPPHSNWPLKTDCLRLWIQFEFMPKGIINQLSADLSSLIEKDEDVWNSGVILKDKEHHSECLLKEDANHKKIILIARGTDARALVVIIVHSLKEIIGDYRGVETDLEVPCRCSICAVAEKPTTIYKYSKLLEWLKTSPNKKLTCNDSEETYALGSLLHDIGLKPPAQGSSPHEKKPYSHNPENSPVVVNLQVTQTNNQEVEVKQIINLKKNKELQTVKKLLEELKKAGEKNEQWQNNLVHVLSEISAIENAPNKQKQQTKWAGMKEVWNALKNIKDAKAISEAVPWVKDKMENISSILDSIDKMFP